MILCHGKPGECTYHVSSTFVLHLMQTDGLSSPVFLSVSCIAAKYGFICCGTPTPDFVTYTQWSVLSDRVFLVSDVQNIFLLQAVLKLHSFTHYWCYLMLLWCLLWNLLTWHWAATGQYTLISVWNVDWQLVG